MAALLAAAPAAAQDFGRVAPKHPKPQTPAPVTAHAAPAALADPGKQLLASLKGLVLVPSVHKIVTSGVNTTGIIADPGLPLLADPGIRAKLAAFLGKPLHQGDLTRISNVIVAWYRSHDLPVVSVAFPKQDITGGTLQAVVTVYKLGQVKLRGAHYFDKDVLKSEMQLKPGDRIDFGKLKADLNRLDRNPFRSVGAVLERSHVPGDTDLDLKVQDRFPLRVYAAYDNDGQPVTSRDEYSVGFNWGNVFGLDQQFSYRFITSPDLWSSRNRGAGHSSNPRFMGHSVDYLAPLPWGDFVSAFGAYVEQVPDLGQNFDQIGHSLQLGLRYEKILPTLGAFSQQLQFGFDYKRSDNNLSFGGTSVFASATNVEQFLLIYSGTLLDGYGQTSFTNQLVASPGGLSDGNTSAVFRASGVAGARADYVYDNLRVTRLFVLPHQMRALIRLEGQLASSELLPSEQLGLGGTGSVRGYDPRVANGSQGVLGSFELHGPAIHPLEHLIGDQAGATLQDSADFFAFFDYGSIAYKNAQQNLPGNTTLDSVGFGLNYSIGRYLDARFDYGWQLAKAPGATSRGGLANVSITMAY